MCKWEAFPNTPFILTDSGLPPNLFIWRHTLFFIFCISNVLSIWLSSAFIYLLRSSVNISDHYVSPLPPSQWSFMPHLGDWLSGLVAFLSAMPALQLLQVFSLEEFIPHPAPPALLLLWLDWQPWLFSVSVYPSFSLMSSLFPSQFRFMVIIISALCSESLCLALTSLLPW